MARDADFMSEWACNRLLLSFYQALDEGRYAEVASYFAPEGEWHRGGSVLRGPAAVERVYEGRSHDTRSRHIVTNLLTTSRDADHVTFSLCITYYAGPGGPAAPTVPGPLMVLSSHGELVRQSGQWCISRKQTIREFMMGATGA